MGEKGRKRLQRKKAKNRTGLIKSLTGPYSSGQHNKRIKRDETRQSVWKSMRNRIFGGG